MSSWYIGNDNVPWNETPSSIIPLPPPYKKCDLKGCNLKLRSWYPLSVGAVCSCLQHMRPYLLYHYIKKNLGGGITLLGVWFQTWTIFDKEQVQWYHLITQSYEKWLNGNNNNTTFLSNNIKEKNVEYYRVNKNFTHQTWTDQMCGILSSFRKTNNKIIDIKMFEINLLFIRFSVGRNKLDLSTRELSQSLFLLLKAPM